MQLISLATASLFLSAALGALASPANPDPANALSARAASDIIGPESLEARTAAAEVEVESEESENDLDARAAAPAPAPAENAALGVFPGECFWKKNECVFKMNGKTNYVKCQTKFANKRVRN
ncbi:uncharacterized protein DSM5745_08054 [Aspergillus mulundensis]|uniref:Uncharacterized protein n=1 Tax=Aspergillus mulundensis TaxID=1810919 RepID=A0A3D8R909_9EURO|nr:hypothetical protein DSM5745_08054 [Aspergillus mulundensis]RDW70543.1 hypothetical protein DSM5745_08054 [Aspergillus mulundensis]